jgi:hypothetical protein
VLLGAKYDACPAQIVRGKFQFHGVTWDDSDEVFAHFARDMGENKGSVGQFDSEKSSWEHLAYDSLSWNGVVFGHGRAECGRSSSIGNRFSGARGGIPESGQNFDWKNPNF